MPKYRVSGVMEVYFEQEVEAEDEDEAEEKISEMDYERFLTEAKKVTFDFNSTDEIGG